MSWPSPPSAVLAGIAILLAVSCVWLSEAARAVPMLVLMPTLTLLALQLWRDRSGERPSIRVARPIVSDAAWLLAAPMLMGIAGVALGSSVFVAGYLILRARMPVPGAMVYAAAAGLLLWALLLVAA